MKCSNAETESDLWVIRQSPVRIQLLEQIQDVASSVLEPFQKGGTFVRARPHVRETLAESLTLV